MQRCQPKEIVGATGQSGTSRQAHLPTHRLELVLGGLPEQQNTANEQPTGRRMARRNEYPSIRAFLQQLDDFENEEAEQLQTSPRQLARFVQYARMFQSIGIPDLNYLEAFVTTNGGWDAPGVVMGLVIAWERQGFGRQTLPPAGVLAKIITHAKEEINEIKDPRLR